MDVDASGQSSDSSERSDKLPSEDGMDITHSPSPSTDVNEFAASATSTNGQSYENLDDFGFPHFSNTNDPSPLQPNQIEQPAIGHATGTDTSHTAQVLLDSTLPDSRTDKKRSRSDFTSRLAEAELPANPPPAIPPEAVSPNLPLDTVLASRPPKPELPELP